MFAIILVAVLLAVFISLVLAEAEVASPVPMYSPVIPPGLKTKLGRLCPRIRFDGRLLWSWRVVKRFIRHRAFEKPLRV